MDKEDMVSVDAMHLRATAKWPGGFFASYHAYPYYPDFMRLQPSYRRAKDPYEAYLKDLRAHHKGQAVMITEFGVPTGIGSAHLGPLGRDQGDHPEQEAGRMDADMLAAIKRQKMAGALLFSYTDEWFKRTWNTMDMENPGDRRQLWHNALTNEEQFGIVAAEAGKTAAVTVDGSDKEWTRTQSQQIYEGGGAVREVRAIHDANWLYLLLRRDGDQADAARLRRAPRRQQGPPRPSRRRPRGRRLDLARPGPQGRPARGRLDRPDRLPVRARAPVRPGRSGRPRARQRRLGAPAADAQPPLHRAAHGREAPDGAARHLRPALGDRRPEGAQFDDRVTVAGGGKTVELRIPWAMLTFSDPSSRQVWVPKADGSVGTLKVGRLGIDVAPAGAAAVSTNGYGWDEWNRVDFHERRKAGWPAVQRSMRSSATSPR